MPTHADVANLNNSFDSLTQTLLRKQMMREQSDQRAALQRTADERTADERTYRDRMATAAEKRSGTQFNGVIEELDEADNVMNSSTVEGPAEEVWKLVNGGLGQGRKFRLANGAAAPKREVLGTATITNGNLTLRSNVYDPKSWQELAEQAKQTQAPGSGKAPTAFSVTLDSGRKVEGVTSPQGAYTIAKPEPTAGDKFKGKVADAKLQAVVGELTRLQTDLAKAQEVPGNETEVAALQKRLLNAQIRLEQLDPEAPAQPVASADPAKKPDANAPEFEDSAAARAVGKRAGDVVRLKGIGLVRLK